MKTTTIEIKNLKYSGFASQETHCFEGTVYVNGERFCSAFNEGHGGCDRYDPTVKDMTSSQLYAKIKKIDAALAVEKADEFKTHTRKDGSTFTIGPDFEWMVCEAVNIALATKEMKAKLRRRLMWLKPNDDPSEGFYSYTIKTKKEVPAAVEQARKTHGDDIRILNLMPEAEALAIWRGA